MCKSRKWQTGNDKTFDDIFIPLKKSGNGIILLMEKLKIIGRRKYSSKGKDSLKEVDKLQRLAMELRKGKPFYPVGIYHFKTLKKKTYGGSRY